MNNFKKLKKSLCFILCFATVITLFSASKITSKAKNVKNNIVVVLDAGHDATHIGAQAENFDEAIANLYIAYYCKQELEKYDGVTVYMTRYGFECPKGVEKNADCLAGRVDFAKSVKADILISLHNDYSEDPNDNGSKVIIPNPNFNPAVCVKGQAMGQSILTQLNATGLNICDWKLCPNGTGIVTRDSAESVYPDGSARDYYALINQAKTAGFPCLIVEHAYCSNFSDKANFLSTPEQYQVLGTADATGIANFYGLTKVR